MHCHPDGGHHGLLSGPRYGRSDIGKQGELHSLVRMDSVGGIHDIHAREYRCTRIYRREVDTSVEEKIFCFRDAVNIDFLWLVISILHKLLCVVGGHGLQLRNIFSDYFPLL